MSPTRLPRRALIAALLALAAGAHAQDGKPRIDQPWIRATPAVGAGYLSITGGATADKLVGASSDAAASVELHTHKMEGGVARMRQVDDVPVPAGQKVEFRPGGLHLMLVGLKRPLKDGEQVAVTLRFEKAGSMPVNFVVDNQRAAPPAAAADPHAGHKH